MPRIVVRSLLVLALFGAVVARARGESFWAFKPVMKPDVPKVDEPKSVANPIDAFTVAKLDEKHLARAKEADKQTLIRRVTFDLTGLPPTPEEIRAFLSDKSADAYEKLV